jgi:hypothetical protein
MRRTLRDLADARKELIEIQQEFVRLQKSIDAVRDCVTDSLTRFFCSERPAITALAEEELIEKLAGRVVARLPAPPKPQAQGENRYVREKEAAAFLGVSVSALRSWRGKRRHSGPPVTRMGKMVVYSVKELAGFAEERTVEGR